MSDYLERDTPGETFKGANNYSDASLLKVLVFVLNRSVGTDKHNISRTCKMTLERIYAEFARRVKILWPLPRDEWNADELNQYNSYVSVYDQTFHFRMKETDKLMSTPTKISSQFRSKISPEQQDDVFQWNFKQALKPPVVKPEDTYCHYLTFMYCVECVELHPRRKVNKRLFPTSPEKTIASPGKRSKYEF
jgi:hypothetical protein